jgi:hypothetical protein
MDWKTSEVLKSFRLSESDQRADEARVAFPHELCQFLHQSLIQKLFPQLSHNSPMFFPIVVVPRRSHPLNFSLILTPCHFYWPNVRSWKLFSFPLAFLGRYCARSATVVSLRPQRSAMVFRQDISKVILLTVTPAFAQDRSPPTSDRVTPGWMWCLRKDLTIRTDVLLFLRFVFGDFVSCEFWEIIGPSQMPQAFLTTFFCSSAYVCGTKRHHCRWEKERATTVIDSLGSKVIPNRGVHCSLPRELCLFDSESVRKFVLHKLSSATS